MKKIFKFLFISCAILAVLAVAGIIALRLLFPMEKVKEQLQLQVKNKLNREVDFKDLSLSLKGLNITDFALSEKTSFKDGIFVSAKQVKASVDLKALFHKQIKIETIGLEDFTINVIKDKEGKFNFDDLLSRENQPASVDSPTQVAEDQQMFEISAKQLYTKNATINFSDEAEDTNFSVGNLDIQIDNFALDKEFSILISCLSKIKTSTLNLDPVLFKIDGLINLASLDLPKAKAEIKDFSIVYKNSSLNLKGLIDDFTNPQVNLTGNLKGIDDTLIKRFTKSEMSPFSIPVINMILSAKVNLEKSLADISQAKISIGNSFIKTRGSVDYSKQDIVFSSNTDMAISLDEISSIAKETLAEFNLKGTLNGNINASQNRKLNVKGNINLKDIGAKLLKQDLEKTNGTITIKSINDISTSKLNGLFALEPWNMTLTYKKEKNTNIDLSFYLKKFTLEDMNFETLLSKDNKDSKEEVQEEKTQKNTKGTSSDLYNLKADIIIDKIENNVLTANNFSIKTDVKDFDLTFAKAQGNLTLNTKDVEIRDIDKLMKSSKLLNVMFTSVKIMQKAFDFAKLDNSSITNGIIKCSVINAEYTLNNGLLNITKSDIDSDLTVVRATGNADLLKDSINMKIQAQLGKTGSSGFKPVVINVKGALSNPSYKVDVLSSLASILSKNKEESSTEQQQDSATEIKGNAKDVIKTISGLFKK
ncbi:MAG: AsmA family protein [Elusimicrobiaceae bacterium]|nr:AsmA family protein [Elusimicrobiaceae bacterium]